MFVELLDWPQIPDELIEYRVEEISELPDHSPHPTYEFFRQYRILDKKLLAHIQQHFDFNVTNRAFYQLIKDGLLIHIDKNRTIIHNYIISAGGTNIDTVWYEADKETETFRFTIPEKTWHQMDVTTNHTVRGITGVRVAITVFEIS